MVTEGRTLMRAIYYIFVGLCVVIAYPVLYSVGFLYGIGKGMFRKGDE